MKWRLDTSLEQLRVRLDAQPIEPVLATIIHTEGSTYRKFGARMLIEADGRLTGLLSGGCLESDLVEQARHVAQSHKPMLVRYDQRGEDDPIFGIGAGCEGAMDILLEPLDATSFASQALRTVFDQIAAGKPAELVIVTDPSHPLAGTHSQWDSAMHTTHFRREKIAPVPRVLILGAGLDVLPLVNILDELHWNSEVADHRQGLLRHLGLSHLTTHHRADRHLVELLDGERFIAAIIMSHHLVSDQTYLAQLANSEIPYIGLLGPKARREKLLAELTPIARTRLLPRLHAPVGLPLGACTPQSIALSICAELHQFASQMLAATQT